MSDQGWIVVGTLGGALGGTAFGGVIGFVIQFFTHRWTRQAAIASERRQARMNERREALAHVTGFLDMAARADAKRFVETSQEKLYNENIGGIADVIPRDKFEAVLANYTKDEPSSIDLQREFGAAAAAAPTKEIVVQLLLVWAWVGQRGAGSTESLRQAIQRARELVEEYLLGAITE